MLEFEKVYAKQIGKLEIQKKKKLKNHQNWI